MRKKYVRLPTFCAPVFALFAGPRVRFLAAVLLGATLIGTTLSVGSARASMPESCKQFNTQKREAWAVGKQKEVNFWAELENHCISVGGADQRCDHWLSKYKEIWEKDNANGSVSTDQSSVSTAESSLQKTMWKNCTKSRQGNNSSLSDTLPTGFGN